MRAWVLAGVAGAVAAVVAAAVTDAAAHSRIALGPGAWTHFADRTLRFLARVGFAWTINGLATAIAVRHLFPRIPTRAWACAAVATSTGVVANGLSNASGLRTPFDDYALVSGVVPTALGVALGAALFALPRNDDRGDVDTGLQWLRGPARVLAALVPLASILPFVCRRSMDDPVYAWDRTHTIGEFPASVFLIYAYVCIALLVFVPRRRLAGVVLPVFVLATFLYLPWQLLCAVRCVAPLVLADALRARSGAVRHSRFEPAPL